jgi:hypothetical protein
MVARAKTRINLVGELLRENNAAARPATERIKYPVRVRQSQNIMDEGDA